MGNHHLEYGFPSTHSTNSTSIALYIHTLIYRLYLSDNISSRTLYLLQAAIAWYTFSIVFGRLYCGMHSFTDCGVGIALGAAVSAAYWVMEEAIERWICTPGWTGKSVIYECHEVSSHIHNQSP
jgi:dihydrosphingosine 1-phosphate phosphatase